MAQPYQRQIFTDTRSSGLTKVVNFGSAPLAGTTLLMAFAIEDGHEVVSITQAGATWARVFERADAASPDTRVELWAAQTIGIGTAQAATVEFSVSAAASVAIIGAEIVNIDLPAVDQIITNNGLGATATTGTTALTTLAVEYAVAAFSSNDNGATHGSPTNGYAIDAQLDGPGGDSTNEEQHLSLLSKVLLAQAAESTGVTISPAPTRWAAGLATLKAFQPGTQTFKGTIPCASGSQTTLDVRKSLSGSASCVGAHQGTLSMTWALSGAAAGISGSVAELLVKTGQPAVLVEIPALYVDDVATDEIGTGNWLVNRDPGPGETNAPADGPIRFDIVNLSASALPPNFAVALDLVIGDDVVIYTHPTGFQNGWTGSVTTIQSPGATAPDGYRFIGYPPDPFDSLESVTVFVAGGISGGYQWTFEIQDLTPPDLIEAVALDQRIVRIQFDEPVRMEGDGAAIDALTPGNYSFEPLNDDVTPAVYLEAVDVTEVSETEVDVLVDIEMTPRVLYEVTVSNVVDVWGNPV